jgi:hypothetical protein
MFVGVVCTVLGGLSQAWGGVILGFVATIIRTAFQFCNYEGPSAEYLCSQIPATIATAMARFPLNSHTVTYAVCPSCHSTYKPEKHSSGSPYPMNCTYMFHPGSPVCGSQLCEMSDNGRITPIKKFVYHDFHDYLAGLLARPDYEKEMDSICDDTAAKVRESNDMDTDDTDPILATNPFDGTFIQNFWGPSGKTLFIERPGSEGRFLFSLNVDFFNPDTLKEHGSSQSCGVISMACLNLPLEIRHNTENIYVAGIIPGLQEPSLSEINHYLRPLLDDMLLSWERGVKLSWTALHQAGQTTRSALAIAVCDLPAARRTSGMASQSSFHYCSVCECCHSATLGRHDPENWTPRDPGKLRQQAEEWKNAPTEAAQQKLFKKHGMRWSELWRLPYWDPTKQLVVDAMHCLLENLAHSHVRDVPAFTRAAASKKTNITAFSHQFREYYDQLPVKLKEHEKGQTSSIHSLLTMPISDLAESSTVADDATMTEPTVHDEASAGSVDEDPRAIPSLTMDELKRKLMLKNRSPLLFVCFHELPDIPLPEAGKLPAKAGLVHRLLEWVSIFTRIYIQYSPLLSEKQSH